METPLRKIELHNFGSMFPTNVFEKSASFTLAQTVFWRTSAVKKKFSKKPLLITGPWTRYGIKENYQED